MSRLIIFTDLDGTLLDHHSYSFDAAKPALDMIKTQAHPLILVSSKTRVEIEKLQSEMGIEAPFVCENGSAVYWPEVDGANTVWEHVVFSKPRSEILHTLQLLRNKHDYHFQSFNDWSIDQLADNTGLSHAQAELAAQREYTEPLLWTDTADRFEMFKLQLSEFNLRAVQGGRFISVMGQFDKLDGVNFFSKQLTAKSDATIVALGDSPNDEQMLNAADIAVVIKSPRSDSLKIDNPKQIIYTKKTGPEGWQEAMVSILENNNVEQSELY